MTSLDSIESPPCSCCRSAGDFSAWSPLYSDYDSGIGSWSGSAICSCFAAVASVCEAISIGFWSAKTTMTRRMTRNGSDFAFLPLSSSI